MSRIDEIRRKLAARRGVGGYEENVKDLEAELHRLQSEEQNNV